LINAERTEVQSEANAFRGDRNTKGNGLDVSPRKGGPAERGHVQRVLSSLNRRLGGGTHTEARISARFPQKDHARGRSTYQFRNPTIPIWPFDAFSPRVFIMSHGIVTFTR